MSRLITLLALLFAFGFLILGSPGTVGGAGSVSAAQDGPPQIGDAVPYVDEEGVARGSVTVVEVVDPYMDFNPDYPPEAGARFVLATVAFDADAGERFDITPWSIVLQDTAGFLWTQSSVTLPEDSVVPELTSETLAPGSRITGVVGFELPDAAAPARVYYQPESSRLIELAELVAMPHPAPGDAVELIDADGGMGTVTVVEIVDPYEDFDPTLTPPEGARFVLLTLTYENTSDARFDIEPYGLLLRDDEGNLWSSTSISRLAEEIVVPDLGSDQLAPGDRRSGVIGFAVPEDAGLAGLYLSPESSQLILLADLREGVARRAADAKATPVSGNLDVSADDACAGVEAWLAAARERIQGAAAMSVQDAQLTDLASLGEHLDAYRSLAEAQLAEPVPAGLEEINAELGDILITYGNAVEQILTAGEPGKDTLIELAEGMNAFNDAGQRLQAVQTELGAIAADCGLT